MSPPLRRGAWAYSEQLLATAPGWPLRPSPCKPTSINIGDVGVIQDGRFNLLFSSMAGVDKTTNPKPKFQPLPPQKIHERTGLPPSVFHSDKMRALQETVGGKPRCVATKFSEASHHVMTSQFSKFCKISCGTSGAAAMIGEAVRQYIDITPAVCAYVHKNHKAWHRKVQKFPLFNKGDLVFVTGLVKTDKWAYVSYCNGDYGLLPGGGLRNATLSWDGFYRPGCHKSKLCQGPQEICVYGYGRSDAYGKQVRGSLEFAPPKARADVSPYTECVFLECIQVKYDFFGLSKRLTIISNPSIYDKDDTRAGFWYGRRSIQLSARTQKLARLSHYDSADTLC